MLVPIPSTSRDTSPDYFVEWRRVPSSRRSRRRTRQNRGDSSESDEGNRQPVQQHSRGLTSHETFGSKGVKRKYHVGYRRHENSPNYRQDIYTFPRISFEGLDLSPPLVPQIIDVPYVSSILRSLEWTYNNPSYGFPEKSKEVKNRKILAPSKRVVQRPNRYFILRGPQSPISVEPQNKPEQASEVADKEQIDPDNMEESQINLLSPPIVRFKQLHIQQPENRVIWVHIDQRQLEAVMFFIQQHAPMLFQHPIFRRGMQIAPFALQLMFNRLNLNQYLVRPDLQITIQNIVRPQDNRLLLSFQRQILPAFERMNENPVIVQPGGDLNEIDYYQYVPLRRQGRFPFSMGQNARPTRPHEQNALVLQEPRLPLQQINILNLDIEQQQDEIIVNQEMPEQGDRNVDENLPQDPEALNVIWEFWNQGGQNVVGLLQEEDQGEENDGEQPPPEEQLAQGQLWHQEGLHRNQALPEQRPDEIRHQLWHVEGQNLEADNQNVNPFQDLLPPQEGPILEPFVAPEEAPNMILELPHPEDPNVEHEHDPEHPVGDDLLPDGLRRHLHRPWGQIIHRGDQPIDVPNLQGDQPDGLDALPLVPQPGLMNINIPPDLPEQPHLELGPLRQGRQNRRILHRPNVPPFHFRAHFQLPPQFLNRRHGFPYEEPNVNRPIALAAAGRRQLPHPDGQDMVVAALNPEGHQHQARPPQQRLHARRLFRFGLQLGNGPIHIPDILNQLELHGEAAPNEAAIQDVAQHDEAGGPNGEGDDLAGVAPPQPRPDQ